MARQNKVCTKLTDLENRYICFQFHDFGEGDKPGDGTNIIFDYGKAPAEIQAQLMAHGASQKGGDSYAGVHGDIDKAIENCGTVIERMMNGDWVKEREAAGARPSMVVDAVVAALIADGQEVSDKRRAGIVGKVKTAAGRKRAMDNPQIKAHYEDLRAKAAAARAKKAKATAKTADSKTVALTDF